jgi:hypothetical protein
MLARATQAWCARRRQWRPWKRPSIALCAAKSFASAMPVEAVRGDLLDVEVLAIGERGVPTHRGRSRTGHRHTPARRGRVLRPANASHSQPDSSRLCQDLTYINC